MLKNPKTRVHFIGIGGVSMSALAKMLRHDGLFVTGSDRTLSDHVKELISLDIPVYMEHRKENIKGSDLIVYTAAISHDNPELVSAKEEGILAIERSTLLGELMKKFRYPINVAGTHGKTTTTSMLSSVFLDGGLNPTISVGGDFGKIGGNLHLGSKEFFICEACEYVESFLKFYPYASLILNIEADHLDYFKDLNQIKKSFIQFANRTHPEGFVILNGEDENCMEIRRRIKVKTYTFGFSKEQDLYAKEISYNEEGFPSFDVWFRERHLGRVTLGVRGEHNVQNALAVILCAWLFEVNFSAISSGLSSFVGAKRRFELKGEVNGIKIYDDYAHHPTELEATLSSLKRTPYTNLFFIFQPHTYTRTKALMKEFAQVLTGVDTLIIADIYAAREKNLSGITSRDLVEKIQNALYLGSFEKIERYVESHAKPGDLIITVGAGDIVTVGETLLKNL